MPDAQAAPVDAARRGCKAPRMSCASKPSNLILELPGWRRSPMEPLMVRMVREAYLALQTPDERITQGSDPHSLLEGCVAGKELGGGTHANAEWHRHSAGTQSRLLPTAVDQRLYSVLQIAANIQGTDALRSVHLVSRKADHIRMHS